MADPERARSSAQDVFRDYGISAIALLGWEIWCIRDGWFRPDYEHIPFSRFMAYLSGPFLIFCAIMAISAGFTVRRQKKQPPS